MRECWRLTCTLREGRSVDELRALIEIYVPVEKVIELDAGPVEILVSGSAKSVDLAVEWVDRYTQEVVQVEYLGRVGSPWRHFRMSPGIWSFGVQRDHGGWHVTCGPWCWTTEVPSG